MKIFSFSTIDLNIHPFTTPSHIVAAYHVLPDSISSRLIDKNNTIKFLPCLEKIRYGILDVINWLSCGFLCRRYHRQQREVQNDRNWTARELLTWNRNHLDWNNLQNEKENFLLLYGMVTARADASISEAEICAIIQCVFFSEMPPSILEKIKHQIWIVFNCHDEGDSDFGGTKLRENPRREEVITAIYALLTREENL